MVKAQSVTLMCIIILFYMYYLQYEWPFSISVYRHKCFSRVHEYAETSIIYFVYNTGYIYLQWLIMVPLLFILGNTTSISCPYCDIKLNRNKQKFCHGCGKTMQEIVSYVEKKQGKNKISKIFIIPHILRKRT